MKQIKLLFLTSLVLVFSACGGGSSSGSDITDPGTDPTTTEWDSANWDELTWQ